MKAIESDNVVIKEFMRGMSYILVFAMLMGLAPIGVFADSAALAVNVSVFTANNSYFTDSTVEDGVLKVVPNSNNPAFNKICKCQGYR